MTKPNCEAIAVANLLRQGYVCYYPRFRDHKPDKSFVVRPLFPRYIFTLTSNSWYSIRGTRGVSYLLMGDGGPAKVPASIIESIRVREDREGFIILDPKDPKANRLQFNKGELVKAIDGPMAGCHMIYEGMSGHDRVRVLANMLGREVPMTIDEKDLVAA